MSHDALKKLIEAVEAGSVSMNDCAAALPSESAYGVCTWHHAWAAHNGSLDAAKALHDALLPGWIVQELSQNSRSMGWNALIVNRAGNYISSHQGGNTGFIDQPGRAWMLATLKAHLATMEARHD